MHYLFSFVLHLHCVGLCLLFCIFTVFDGFACVHALFCILLCESAPALLCFLTVCMCVCLCILAVCVCVCPCFLMYLVCVCVCVCLLDSGLYSIY